MVLYLTIQMVRYLLVFCPKPLSTVGQAGVAGAVEPVQGEAAANNLPAGQPVDDGAGLSELLNETALQNGAPVENIKRNKGDVFYYQKTDGEMALWQALENTIAGTDPNGSNLFMEISQYPNGQVVETKKSFSDLETFSKGDQIYMKGNSIRQQPIFRRFLTRRIMPRRVVIS